MLGRGAAARGRPVARGCCWWGSARRNTAGIPTHRADKVGRPTPVRHDTLVMPGRSPDGRLVESSQSLTDTVMQTTVRRVQGSHDPPPVHPEVPTSPSTCTAAPTTPRPRLAARWVPLPLRSRVRPAVRPPPASSPHPASRLAPRCAGNSSNAPSAAGTDPTSSPLRLGGQVPAGGPTWCAIRPGAGCLAPEGGAPADPDRGPDRPHGEERSRWQASVCCTSERS